MFFSSRFIMWTWNNWAPIRIENWWSFFFAQTHIHTHIYIQTSWCDTRIELKCVALKRCIKSFHTNAFNSSWKRRALFVNWLSLSLLYLSTVRFSKWHVSFIHTKSNWVRIYITQLLNRIIRVAAKFAEQPNKTKLVNFYWNRFRGGFYQIIQWILPIFREPSAPFLLSFLFSSHSLFFISSRSTFFHYTFYRLFRGVHSFNE